MAERWEELRALSDEEVTRRHDQVAGNQVVGVLEYRAELARRDASRQTEEIRRLTEEIRGLTANMRVAAYAALAVSIVALALSAVAIFRGH
ncbi:MAG: hypothetical protein M3O91_01450 [Chloroflexota bacterium]|nr:hypothetical protein [Chloroflexota bacterium]